jgi:hypothetical protein
MTNYKEKQIGVAFITQKEHKASLAMSGPDLMGVPKKWVQAGDGPEPVSPFPYVVGPGKLTNQLAQVDVQKQLLVLPDSRVIWSRVNMDVSMVHDGKPVSKPDGSPWDSVERLGKEMLTRGKKREMRFDNIVTTHTPLLDSMKVDWRSIGLLLPEALIRWLADPGQIEQHMHKGWVDPHLVTEHSIAGLRWDQLPKIWSWLRKELGGVRAGKNLRVIEHSSGRVIQVDDVQSGVEADALMEMYTRGVVPGLMGALIGHTQRAVDAVL